MSLDAVYNERNKLFSEATVLGSEYLYMDQDGDIWTENAGVPLLGHILRILPVKKGTATFARGKRKNRRTSGKGLQYDDGSSKMKDT